MESKPKYNIDETRNLSECMSWVKSFMTSEGEDEFIKWSKAEEEDAVISLHMDFGMFIRNTLELWHDGPAVSWFNKKGIYHADDMSDIIFTSLHRTVNNKNINLEEQIKYYRDYWEKQNPEINKGNLN